MRARYYSPELMRFLSEDTVVGSLDKVGSLNRYAFCGGNPVGYIDPSGHSMTAAIGGTAIAGTAVITYIVTTSDGVQELVREVVDGAVDGVIDVATESWEAVKSGATWLYDKLFNNDKKDENKSVDSDKSLPTVGEPDTYKDLLNPDGTLRQRRYYGPDGRASIDVDYNHGGTGHEFPHKHDWDWSGNKPTRSNGKPNNAVIKKNYEK